jgi:hypothetical protein
MSRFAFTARVLIRIPVNTSEASSARRAGLPNDTHGMLVFSAGKSREEIVRESRFEKEPLDEGL